MARDVPGFDVADRVVLGNFSYAKLPMVNDLDAALAGGQLATSELLAAIAGDAGAAQAALARHPGVTADEPDKTPPADEFLVLDADASQSYAINTAVRGSVVEVQRRADAVGHDRSVEFFVSYTASDRTWAEWIAWQLEDAGHSVVIQAWDFRPASDFVAAMREATANAERTLAVLSPEYLNSDFALSEWGAAYAAGGDRLW